VFWAWIVATVDEIDAQKRIWKDHAQMVVG